MRKYIFTFLLATSMCLTGCMHIEDILPTEATTANRTTADATENVTTEEETEAEQLEGIEAQAAELIDDSIKAALEAVKNIYRNPDIPTESMTIAPYVNPDDLIEKYTTQQQWLFKELLKYGYEETAFRIKAEDYPGDSLIIDYLTVGTDLLHYEPRLDCYYDIEMTGYDELSDLFFDPDKDANFPVEVGSTEFQEVQGKMALMDAVIKRIVKKMPADLSAYDRYYYLACVVAHHTTYDETPRNSHTAYGSLIGGQSVCEGYSETFLLLCREAGLYCRLVYGLAAGGQGHQWNAIMLDNQVYYTDVTWCDGDELGSMMFDRYFAMTKEECEGYDHVFTD